MFSPACEPQTDKEWLAYYDLRWRILRKPWGQPLGNEKDVFDDTAVHRCIIDDKQNIIAIGRLHFIDENTAQIRYMAVEPQYEKQGLGSAILQSLEQAALQNNIHKIMLHSRDTAIGFYEKRHYQKIKPSHTLYNEIKHILMEKQFKAEK